MIMWVEIFLVPRDTCLHYDIGNEYYFKKKGYPNKLKHFQFIFPILLLYSFAIGTVIFDSGIENFHNLSDTQNMIDLPFNFWFAFILDLSLLMCFLRKIDIKRQ